MHDLDRFRDAQRDHLDTALAELAAGRKRSHWMWFVFPQHVALGRSATARHYGINGLDHARAYLADAALAANLAAAFGAMLGNEGRAAEAVLGPVDAMKLRSSATLWEAAGDGGAGGRVLAAFYGGRGDVETLRLL